jgi:hypothetical protein
MRLSNTQGVDMLSKKATDQQPHQGSRKDVRKWMIAGVSLLAILSSAAIFAGNVLPNPLVTLDAAGLLSTYDTSGGVDLSNPFFQNLGTNGRTCASCHQPTDAWSVTPLTSNRGFISVAATIPFFVRTTEPTAPAPMFPTFKLASLHTAYSCVRD